MVSLAENVIALSRHRNHCGKYVLSQVVRVV